MLCYGVTCGAETNSALVKWNKIINPNTCHADRKLVVDTPWPCLLLPYEYLSPSPTSPINPKISWKEGHHHHHHHHTPKNHSNLSNPTPNTTPTTHAKVDPPEEVEPENLNPAQEKDLRETSVGRTDAKSKKLGNVIFGVNISRVFIQRKK